MTSNLNRQQLEELEQALKALSDKYQYNQIGAYFPSSGEYSRDKYPKHLEFFRQSKFYRIMALIGANGIGKSLLGTLMTYFHLSGKYPIWWEGHRFERGPISGWMASIEGKQLRSVQDIMFGSAIDVGTGVIPREDLLDDDGNTQVYAMGGTTHCFGICYIRHYTNGKFDGYSKLEFKTYLQGWAQFQGANLQWIWLDEEPDDAKIYRECLMRLRGPAGREGRILCTFTPTHGYTQVYLSFLPNGVYPPPPNPNKYVLRITWDDVPHLSADWKQAAIEEIKATNPLELRARTHGEAAMGAGKVFPVEEEFFIIPRFEIPDYFPRAYGLDFGWHATAAVWVTQDPVTKIKYVYAEYKRGGVHDSMHVQAVEAKGKWIPGICDPHSGRRDGGELRADYYRGLGLSLVNGKSNVQTGIAMLLNDLQTGQLKIMCDCVGLINEIRTYRWDPNNPSTPADKQDDHEIDSLKYCYSMFDYAAKSYQDACDEEYGEDDYTEKKQTGRDELSGY